MATERGAAYAQGWDEGQAAIWDELVCSICGNNHDRDESAACEHSGIVTFSEWQNKIQRWLSSRQVHPDQERANRGR